MSDTLFTRRAFLGLLATTSAGAASGGLVSARAGDRTPPVTGVASSDLEPFDQLMTSFLQEHKIPGAALAVTRSGKLVYARGFGYSDVEKMEPVPPGALFRIASVSKPITAVAIMQLVEKGKLTLDDKIMDRMKLSPFVVPGGRPDPRWKEITIRQCLQHTGGWDRNKSYDPIGKPWDIATALHIRPPVTPAHVVQYMMGQPLDFDPGERYAYSNLGYLVLGRVLEAVTGQRYDVYVKKQVLAPLRIKSMQLGRALFENRAKGEVKYYDTKTRAAPALYPPHLREQVPIQYGGSNLEAYEAHGGWIASAVDLVKFATAFDDPARCPLLGARAIKEMWSRPNGSAGYEACGKPKAAFYGCGWMVRPVGDTKEVNAWHTGFITGSESLLVRRWDGLDWAVLFNTAIRKDGKVLTGLIDSRVHEAAARVKAWPTTDMFGGFLK